MEVGNRIGIYIEKPTEENCKKNGTGYFDEKINKKVEKYHNIYNLYIQLDECCICLEETDQKLKCGHTIHYQCYFNLSSCPICNKQNDKQNDKLKI